MKIDFIKSLDNHLICTIWDADTIPLKDLEFIDDNNKLIFRLGTHTPRIHKPYFDLISSLLNISSKIEGSFISQCFPTHTNWVVSFCAHIEKKVGKNVENKDWLEIIIDYLNRSPSESGFSEYESLGSYFNEFYPDKINITQGEYYRPANFFCEPSDLRKEPFSRWALSQEYLAFDSYLNEKCSGLNIGCGNTRMTSHDGNLSINVDKSYTPFCDIVLDLEDGLPFKDGQFNHIVAHNILEHVGNLYKSMLELDRVLSNGGIFQIEVPHIGSYNHGTDITHTRGMTFDSFNFLLSKESYLFPLGNSPFKYKLISFNRENLIDGRLTREYFDSIPPKGSYSEWLRAVNFFEIPGIFGFIFQKY